jgi:hypothetical protein
MAKRLLCPVVFKNKCAIGINPESNEGRQETLAHE